MTTDQETVLIIKGSIAELPAEAQAKVNQSIEALRKVLEDGQPYSYMAFALIGAELAAIGPTLKIFN